MNIKYLLKVCYYKIGIHASPPGTFFHMIHSALRALFRSLRNPPVVENASPTPEVSSKELVKVDKDTLRVAVYSGIGDVLWSLVFVKALLKKYKKKKLHVIVQSPPGDRRGGRSADLLRRFSCISSVEGMSFEIMKTPAVCAETGFYRYIDAGETMGEEKDLYDYRFFVNTYLEHGLSYEEIADKLGFDKKLIDLDVFQYYKEEPNDALAYEKIKAVCENGYAVFYLSSLAANTTAGFNKDSLWKIEDWVKLAQKVHKEFGLKIILTGASYDLDYYKEFYRAYGKDFHKVFINTIGQCDMPETLVILKNAKFVVAYPSGIPICATFLDTPTAMFWRPQHLSIAPDQEKLGFAKEFATCWVPPLRLKEKRYIDLWFGTDDHKSVFKKIKEAGWV